MVGAAVAGPSAAKITTSKVRKIAKAQIANVVLSTSASVAAGSHTAALVCNHSAGTGPVTKDDAAIQITAVPN